MKKIVKEYKAFEKDSYTGAIINKDIAAYNLYKRKREAQKIKDLEMNNLKTKVDHLTTMVEKILLKLDK